MQQVYNVIGLKAEEKREVSSIVREKAVEVLQSYVSDTLDCIDTVNKFCNINSKWMLQRAAELDMMRDIQERENQLNPSIGHVFKSTDKGKAIGEYFGSMLGFGNIREELEKELATVLKNILEGFEKLTYFLDAVEKLAVTSQHVFTVNEEVVKLNLGICLESVEDSISAARLVCPLLLQFKRDAGLFFHPSLHNVPVFMAELTKYICTTENICTLMYDSSTSGSEDTQVKLPVIQFSEDLTEDVLKNITHHVNQLDVIRMEKTFRMVYLFQQNPVSGQCCEHHPRMLQFLDDMEDSATQLDRLKIGPQTSRVSSNSMGAIGGILGILFIVGLALAPFTTGLSLGLILGGLGLGVISRVNSTILQFIRARAALLRSELDAWQKMHVSMHCGMLELERGQSILRQSLIDLLKDGKGK